MTSSLKKISRSVEDPSTDEEHNWNQYLIETNSEAAPTTNFKQSLIPPKNEFNLGEKLETVDPRNRDAWCIGTVIGTVGPRIRIRLDGTDDRNDFWRLVDAADIRTCGTTAKLGGQIVPPLGFQQNSTRWAKYFERYVKNEPFADESCFKSQPVTPEKNLFQTGQKLEAVDPRHPELICPATVTSLIPGGHRIILSLDGWSAANDFKVDYFSRDIFPVGWCRSAGIRIGKVGGFRTCTLPLTQSQRTKTLEKQNGNVRQSASKGRKFTLSSVSNHSSYPATTFDDDSKKTMTNENIEFAKVQASSSTNEFPNVTVYWNYVGDNGGMLLNPQRFHSSMSSIFGPSDYNSVFQSILNSSIKCSFQPMSFINRIRDLFSALNAKKSSSTQIQLENGMLVYIPSIENEDEFWEVIRVFENGILAGNDLFISTPPSSHSTVNLNQKEDSSLVHSLVKRKSEELNSENQTFLTNSKVLRSTSKEKSVYDTETSFNQSKLRNNTKNQAQDVSSDELFRHPEWFTSKDVAAFIRKIDPSFNRLAARFLQEEIDGKALLLLTTDTLMRHLGLKLGPSLKIIDHIEKLKTQEHS